MGSIQNKPAVFFLLEKRNAFFFPLTTSESLKIIANCTTWSILTVLYEWNMLLKLILLTRVHYADHLREPGPKIDFQLIILVMKKRHYYTAVSLNISSTNVINSKWCYLQTNVEPLWSDHWCQEDTVSIAEILEQAIALYSLLAELFSFECQT